MDYESVAHYNILERIGAGGMGEVFRARDTRLGRTVALKMLPRDVADSPERRERFMQEARAAAALSHPSIVVLFEVGEADGRLYLAYEYVPGQTLRRILAEGPMHPKRAVPLAIQIADALADAHSAGIIHRDIKPDNVIVTPKGSAKVLDFGLASWTSGGELREAAPTHMDTSPDQVLGTVAYMSPEQALAQPLDGRTDIFSLGVVLYEMLTGRNPFAAPTLAATLVNILKAAPEPPSRVNRNLPEALDPIVMRMLAHDVQGRYASAAVVASELRAAYAERTEHVFEDDLPKPQPTRRRGWTRWVAAAVVIVALAAGGYAARADIHRAWKQSFGTPPPPVIAVIPLDEIGQEQTYFADGLTDDLVMRLGQTAGLRVLGRSATRGYRGRQPAEVARQTNASVVLTGTVQRDGDNLKINLELIDPADNVQVWRQQFVNPAGGVLAAQAVIADEVARALRVQLSPTQFRERSMARTVSPEAYDVYTRGLDALARRDLDGAVNLFESAVRLDDGLAEAYAGLAEALFLRADRRNGLDDPDQVRVKQMAARAATIEPDLAIVDIAQGLAAASYREALQHFARAATRDPSSAEAIHQLADHLVHVDTARAIRMYERARTLDPRMMANYGDLLFARSISGDPQGAAGEIEALRRVSPENQRLLILPNWLAPPGDRQAIDRLKELAAKDLLPPVAMVALAQRQATAGLMNEALTSVETVLARTPNLCEAKALRVGLLKQLKRDAALRALGGWPSGNSARCSALAAASVGNAPATAVELQRVATDEFALRSWIEVRVGSTGESSLESGFWPWGQVVQAPEVKSAHASIRDALVRLRRIADEELRGLP